MASTDRSVILSIKGLKKSYGDLVAVNGLSLDIFRGEIFGFLGPNGAGKTTTIQMICGLLKSDAGAICVNGMQLNRNTRECQRRLGLSPQDIVIWESLTCLEQLEFTGRLYNMKRQAARKKSLELLDMLGLMEKRNKLGKTLSGGMKRRLNIALALVHNPEILILDEPQAGLDPQSRLLIRRHIQSLREKRTVILTTHDMDEADRLADRLAIVDHGRLLVLDSSDNLINRIGSGDILEIKVQPGHDEKIERMMEKLPGKFKPLTYQQGRLKRVGPDIIREQPVLLDMLRSFNIQIEDLTVRKKTLEDVFIHLTRRGLRE